MLPDRYRSSVRMQCCKLLAIKGVFHWLNAQYDMSLLVRITLTNIGIAPLSHAFCGFEGAPPM